MARHPNRQQLVSWLDGSSVDFETHIEGCDRCAAELGELSDAPPTDLRPALLTLLNPPDDLHERVSERIARRLQSRNDVDLFRSLLGVPFETGRLFIDNDSPSNQSNDDDPSVGE